MDNRKCIKAMVNYINKNEEESIAKTNALALLWTLKDDKELHCLYKKIEAEKEIQTRWLLLEEIRPGFAGLWNSTIDEVVYLIIDTYKEVEKQSK